MEMPADRPTIPAFADAVFRFDHRDEFLQKEIAVAHRAVGGIDVESSSAFRRDDKKFSHLVLPAKIVEQRPSATVEEGSLVVAEAVKKIQHGIFLCGVLACARLVAGRKVDAVVNRMFQNAAIQRVALDAALSVRRKRSSKSREQYDDSERAIHRFQFIRSVRPARDRAGLRVLPGKGRQRDSRGKRTIGRTPPATTALTRNALVEMTGS